MNALLRIDRIVGSTLKVICFVCFAVLLVLMTFNVLFRFVPIMSFHWFEEIVEWAFAWLVFFGSAALWRDREHFKIDWLYSKIKNPAAGFILKLFINILCLFFFAVMIRYGISHTARTTQWTNVLRIPRRLLYSCVPVSGSIMLIYTVRDLTESFRTYLLRLKGETP